MNNEPGLISRKLSGGKRQLHENEAMKINCYLYRANWFLENKKFSKIKRESCENHEQCPLL